MAGMFDDLPVEATQSPPTKGGIAYVSTPAPALVGAPQPTGMFDDLPNENHPPVVSPEDQIKAKAQSLGLPPDMPLDQKAQAVYRSTRPQRMETEGRAAAADNPALSGMLATATGAMEGTPIAGPAIVSGIQHAAAGIGSAAQGIPYEDALARVQGGQKEANEKNPGLRRIGNVGGAVIGTMAGAQALDALAPAAEIGSRMIGVVGSPPGRALQGALGGAAVGAADATARDETPEGGALAGGAMGILGPPVGEVAGGLARWIMHGATPAPAVWAGLNPAGRNILQQAMQGTTPQAMERGAERLGPYGMIGEMTPRLQSKLAGIANSGDVGEEIAQNAFYARDAYPKAPPGGIGPVTGPATRISQGVTEAFGPQTDIVAKTAQDVAARKSAADPLYKAWGNTPVPMTPELTSILDLPVVQKAIPLARNKALNQGNNFLDSSGNPTPQTWDYIKRQVDDLVRKEEYGSDDARIYTGVSTRIKQAIDNHPDPNVAGVWQQARQAWADPTSIMNAREYGQKALTRSNSVDQMRRDMAPMSGPEVAAVSEGMRDQVQQMMDGARRGDTTARNVLLSPGGQQKLAMVVGPDRSTALTQRMEQEEATKGSTQATIGGSPTAGRAEDIKGVGPPPPGEAGLAKWWHNLVIDRPSAVTNVVPRMRDQFVQQQYAQGREQLAPLLTAPRGGNDALVQQLLQGAQRNAQIAGASSNINDLATALMNSGGSERARRATAPYQVSPLHSLYPDWLTKSALRQ